MILVYSLNFLKIILFFFVNSYFLIVIRDNLITENSITSTLYLYFYLYGVIILQIFFLYFFQKKKYFDFYFFIFLFYNFYSLNLSINSSFIILPRYEKVFYLLVSLLIFIVLFSLFFKKKK